MDRQGDGWIDMCWVLCRVLYFFCCFKQFWVSGQSQLLRSWGRVSVYDLIRWFMIGKVVGVRNRFGEGRCQERSGKDGWIVFGVGGRESWRGMFVRVDGRERGRRAIDALGLISNFVRYFQSIDVYFFRLWVIRQKFVCIVSENEIVVKCIFWKKGF